MKLLTIIVSYNFERWMTPCLNSLRKSQYPTDILVIDNHSQDHTCTRLTQEYPEVRLIAHPENAGFGKANNLGFEVALQEGYDAVFLLNQDAWIEPDTLRQLVQTHQSHPEYGILSPVHLTGAGDALDRGFAGYSQQTSLQSLIAGSTGQPVSLSFVNAAFWFIPISILKTVGGFCPLFYHYGEDVDYIHRLHFHGYQAGYVPTAFGCHDRAYRAVSREAWLYSEQVYLLTEYANVNYSFAQSFAYGVLAAIKKAGTSLLHGHFADAGAYLRITGRLLSRSAEVQRYKSHNQHAGSSYIHH